MAWLAIALFACVSSDMDNDGFTVASGDCDDDRPRFNPNAPDYADDDADQNCDGVDGEDHDGDGYASEDSGGDDCNDNNVNVNPGRPDPTGDSLDADCNGSS